MKNLIIRVVHLKQVASHTELHDFKIEHVEKLDPCELHKTIHKWIQTENVIRLIIEKEK